jgi:hypothetical protein
MFIAKMSLSRRTFLRGAGATIALPLLDAMVPAFTPLAKAAAAPRTRFGAIYIPNGAIVDEFFPKSFGTNWEFTPILKPLEPFKNQIVVVKNLTRSHPGSQVGDHAVSAAGFLTGVWPKRTEAEDVLANTTIDQIIAQQIGQDQAWIGLRLTDAAGQFTECFSFFMRCCNIQEYQFVGPFRSISGAQFNGIAGIPQIQEIRSFHCSSVLNIETGNNPFS